MCAVDAEGKDVARYVLTGKAGNEGMAGGKNEKNMMHLFF